MSELLCALVPNPSGEGHQEWRRAHWPTAEHQLTNSILRIFLQPRPKTVQSRGETYPGFDQRIFGDAGVLSEQVELDLRFSAGRPHGNSARVRKLENCHFFSRQDVPFRIRDFPRGKIL